MQPHTDQGSRPKCEEGVMRDTGESVAVPVPTRLAQFPEPPLSPGAGGQRAGVGPQDEAGRSQPEGRKKTPLSTPLGQGWVG